MSFDADPLFNEKNAFYKGLYSQVLNDAADKPDARSLVLRSKIALDAPSAVKELKSAKDELGRAAYSLALQITGKTTESTKIVDALLSSQDVDVQIIVATVLVRQERTEEATDLLSTIEENLDAVALLIQIYLDTHQVSLAQSTLAEAKQWAQDAELIQLADMWVSLRVGGTDNYQNAFYTAQEMADSIGTPSRMLLAQAVAEIQLRHFEEAEATLQQVLEKEPGNADALANMVVLQTHAGKDTAEALENLTSTAPSHPLVLEIAQKSTDFDTLASNYTFVEA